MLRDRSRSRSPPEQRLVITGRADSLVGVAGSATEGTVGPEQLAQRPILRPVEVLESIPGVIITQHAGGGKANQFFLRGFNLDHGTDFATSVGGVPINLPSHAHGQGYTDLNFLIPELIERVDYQKGPAAYRGGSGAPACRGSRRTAVPWEEGEVPFAISGRAEWWHQLTSCGVFRSP